MTGMFDYMDDCIHLKACRRIQKISKSLRFSVPRYCTDECSAYFSGDGKKYVDVESATHTARLQYDGRSDPCDVYCPWDFDGKTISQIIEDQGDA